MSNGTASNHSISEGLFEVQFGWDGKGSSTHGSREKAEGVKNSWSTPRNSTMDISQSVYSGAWLMASTSTSFVDVGGGWTDGRIASQRRPSVRRGEAKRRRQGGSMCFWTSMGHL